MQTFIVYRGFAKTAAALDMQRLGKQRVETLQILRALRHETDAYANHPAVKMWAGYEEALVLYGLIITHEWRVVRKFADNTWGQFVDIGKDYGMFDYLRTDGGSVQWSGTGFKLPPWTGEDWILRSHRSNLIRKLAVHYGDQFGSTPDNMPYIWPDWDESHRHGYRLRLSRPDLDRVNKGERVLPRQIELIGNDGEVRITE
jgi:hypothetical protein